MSFRTLIAKRRLLAAAAVVASLLVTAPAAGATTVASGYGIAAAGTVAGSLTPLFGGTGVPVTVQFATVQNCLVPSASSFAAHWSDPAGTHSLRLVPGADTNQCTAVGSGQIQNAWGGSAATETSPGDSYVSGYLNGPSIGPGTVSFTVICEEGGTEYLLSVGTQAPGPLQGAPGRVQPFGIFVAQNT
jgi:hypothetical protein